MTTAILKIIGGAGDSSVLSPFQFWLVIAVEVVVAIVVMFVSEKIGYYAILLLAFGALAMQSWLGPQDCNCFGDLELSYSIHVAIICGAAALASLGLYLGADGRSDRPPVERTPS